MRNARSLTHGCCLGPARIKSSVCEGRAHIQRVNSAMGPHAVAVVLLSTITSAITSRTRNGRRRCRRRNVNRESLIKYVST